MLEHVILADEGRRSLLIFEFLGGEGCLTHEKLYNQVDKCVMAFFVSDFYFVFGEVQAPQILTIDANDLHNFDYLLRLQVCGRQIEYFDGRLCLQ
jgi:hypothetical protein